MCGIPPIGVKVNQCHYGISFRKISGLDYLVHCTSVAFMRLIQRVNVTVRLRDIYTLHIPFNGSNRITGENLTT